MLMGNKCNRFYSNSLTYALLLFAQLVVVVSGQSWDGIIVTEADHQSLQAIKHDLVDPTGVLRSWNGTAAGACSGSWAGIRCLKGQVVALQLPWKGLGGRISESIGELRALRRISLHDNFLSGEVPLSLGFLPDLRGVYLFNNRFSGQVPASIGNCRSLQTLDLSNNSLVGSVPTNLAKPTRLFRLNLSFNSLSGSFPISLMKSRSLAILALQGNNFSGPIPVSIAGLARLQILDLSDNAMNGSLPAGLSNLSSLVYLNLGGNRLGGEIPKSSFTGLRNLSSLVLRDNRFSGEIPEAIGEISGLSLLDLSGNRLRGEIPESLTKLANLSSFSVARNNLSGAVPSLLSKRFNSTSFVGNIQLCGYSVTTACPSPPPESPSPSVSPSPAKKKKKKLSTKDILLIAAGALLVVLLLLCCSLLCCFFLKKRRTEKKSEEKVSRSVEKVPEVESGGETGGKLVHFDGTLAFTADDLLCATAEITGKSAYGTAYKATLEDGSQVAVKRLREKMTRGQKEFEAEAAALGKIRHPNILALRAYYLGPKGEKLLVYDYMPKGTLASFLHARGPETVIDWPTRLKIGMGVTRGLVYLHKEENTVHGNLTSGNVLLDDQGEAHIADTGLSRLMTTAAHTNVVATAGSLGYSAPELAKSGKKATPKTDVYGLGVIVLELLTGKSPGEPTNGMDLPQWVASIVKEEWTNEVFDLDLMRDAAPSTGDDLLNALKLALHCVDPSPDARPDATQVLAQLEDINNNPDEPPPMLIE